MHARNSIYVVLSQVFPEDSGSFVWTAVMGQLETSRTQSSGCLLIIMLQSYKNQPDMNSYMCCRYVIAILLSCFMLPFSKQNKKMLW